MAQESAGLVTYDPEMCFSATASFVSSGILGSLGVVTLSKVKHRRELLFAAMPTFFAVHQGIEGFVWLGLDGMLSAGVMHAAAEAYMLYAQGLLPFLLPLGVMLFEPGRRRRRAMLPFTLVGGLTALYMLWGLMTYPLQVYVEQNSIVYVNAGTNHTWLAVLYVIATCGSLFFSQIKDMVIFGFANMAILLVVIEVKRYAFTSVWCAYAAIASLIVLAYFWKSQVERPFHYVVAR